MKIKKIKNKFFIKQIVFALTLIFIFPLCFSGSVTNAETNYPKIDVETSTKQIETPLGKEFEIKYKLIPHPIPVNAVNQKSEKNIVLVIDTSGSMNEGISYYQTKMEALKSAAKNFIEKFKNIPNVNIGIVSYSNFAAKQSEIISANNKYKDLEYTIDKLDSNGGTNIGDGIRVGTKMLLNTDKNSKRYLVLMTDGEPTNLSYKSSDYIGEPINYYSSICGWIGYDYNHYYIDDDGYLYYRKIDYGKKYRNLWSYFGINDNENNLKIATYYTSDPDGYCLKYSKMMAANIYQNDISSFFIGFGRDSNKRKLKMIANVANGKPEDDENVTNYFDADSANAISNIYSSIADKIKKECVIQNVKLNLNLPKQIEISKNEINIEKQGNKDNKYMKYIKKIPNIIYKLNNSKTEYIADPIVITVKLKCKEEGSFTISHESANDSLTYNNVKDNEVKQKLPKISVNSKSFNGGFNINRKIVPESLNNQVDINKPFKIQYTIIPNPIQYKFSREPKEMSFTIDGNFKENFPKEFTEIEKANDKLQFEYIYNKRTKQYNAKPIVFYETAVLNKIGRYTLSNDASFSYKELYGETKTKYFNDLNIGVNDNYIIKQGLFQPDNKTASPEDYIKPINSLNIVSDSTNRIGTYVRTSGQATNVQIDLNNTKSQNLEKIYDVNVNVYRINPNGKLELYNEANVKIDSNIINVNLPSGNIDTSGYNHYIINYNFKAKSKDDSNVDFDSLASIQETNASSKLNFIIGSLPDLF